MHNSRSKDVGEIVRKTVGLRPGRTDGWLVVLRIYVTLAVFQPYRDLGAGDNPISEIQVASTDGRRCLK